MFSKDEVDSDGVYTDNDDSSDKKKYSTAITIRDTPLARTDGRRSTIFYHYKTTSLKEGTKEKIKGLLTPSFRRRRY